MLLTRHYMREWRHFARGYSLSTTARFIYDGDLTGITEQFRPVEAVPSSSPAKPRR